MTTARRSYSDDTVVNGTLGFGGAISGDLRVVALNDGTASYLGLESDANVLSADLIGLGTLLQFHAYGGTLKLNQFGGTATEEAGLGQPGHDRVCRWRVWGSTRRSICMWTGSVALCDASERHAGGRVGTFSLDVGQVSGAGRGHGHADQLHQCRCGGR